MLFFRLRPSFGYLALFALAFQAAMALGHIHTHKHPRADSLDSRAITYGACAPTERPQCPPADHDDNETACAICWSMQVAKSAVLDPPLAIKLPSNIVEAHRPIPSAVSTRSNDTVHFQARGPPRVQLT
jgi:hypothetical protein